MSQLGLVAELCVFFRPHLIVVLLCYVLSPLLHRFGCAVELFKSGLLLDLVADDALGASADRRVRVLSCQSQLLLLLQLKLLVFLFLTFSLLDVVSLDEAFNLLLTFLLFILACAR